MAGHEWDWFQREELIGQISDIRVQNLQVERENVQKRTFTRWINMHLEKCSSSLKVKDLFADIKDGKILMALLEILSGHNLLHEYKPSSHRIFRLNNIAKALKFLEDSNPFSNARFLGKVLKKVVVGIPPKAVGWTWSSVWFQVKLVSIDAAEIADGNSSMVLGLIWNIILFFQIKELTGNLNRNSSSSSLSSGPSGPDSDTSHPSTPNVERSMSVSVKDQRKAIKALLTWVQRKTRKYGVAVQDFASSWRSGLAFLAVIKAIDSNLVDMKQALEKSSRENLEDAFTLARDHLGIPRLLEPEDIMVNSPDEQSIVTYLAQFLEHFPEHEGEDFSDPDKEFPIESTYVHVRDSPGEIKQEKILILNENEEHSYAVHQERIPSPPSKIHIPNSPLAPEDQNLHTAVEELRDSLNHLPSDHPERLTEAPPSEQPERPSSLPITEPVRFPPSSISDVFANKVNGHEETRGNTKDSLKQKDTLLPTPSTYCKHSLDSVRAPENGCEELNVQEPTENLRNEPEHTAKDHPGYPAPGSPEEESVHRYILQMLHEEIIKLPENARLASDLQKIHATPLETDGSSSEASLSCPSGPLSPPIRNTPKSLDVTNEAGSLAKMSSNTSKISIIPHDLFYYPHYDVPISAVLDAFAAPEPDPSLSRNRKICAELLVDCLSERESSTVSNEAGLRAEVEVSPVEIDDNGLEKWKKDTTSIHNKSSLNHPGPATIGKKANSHMSSVQKDSTHPDVPVIVVNQFDTAAIVTAEERKTPEARSKRKEKRKNKAILQTENVQCSKMTRLLDNLEEDSTEHEGLSRVSHSDPNVIFQSTDPAPSSKENDSAEEPKSTSTDENTNLSVRKRKDHEKKEVPEKAGPQSNTSQQDQPELFYFIVFLWVLVYCLLLIPQLVSRLH